MAENLLPFPQRQRAGAADGNGGRIFFLIVELVRRKKIPPEKEGTVHFIGLTILLTFMLIVTVNDIFKLIR